MAPNANRRIYCSPVCAHFEDTPKTEDRDSLITQLLYKGHSRAKIALATGLSRQRVIQLAQELESQGLMPKGLRSAA